MSNTINVEGFDYNEYLKDQELLMNSLIEAYGGNKILVLNDILPDKEKFQEIYGDIYYILEEGFEIEKIRKFPVKVTFNKNSGNYINMELRHLIINMIFLRAFVELDVEVELDDSYLFDAYNINNNAISKYINEKIIIPYRDIFTETEELIMKLNIVLHDLIFRLNKIPKDFNMLMGLTLNLEDSFIKMSNENERFDEIIRTDIPEHMQPKEIEEYLNGLMKEEIEILKSNDNCFQPLLIAGTGIKDQQLREFSISGGMKSDLLGNTIPIPINSNFVVGGLNTVTNYYLDAQASRKPLIANKEKMGNSGHLSLLLKLSCVGTYISEVDDCHTAHTVELTINDKKFLNKCVGRYYRLPGSKEFKILKSSDVHLIGKKLLFRDPSKCACKDGICKTCYGTLSKVNKGMDVGIYAATIISRPLGQNILSTKHLNTTNSCLIEFIPIFDNFFKLESNQIKLLNDNETDDIELTDYEMVIDNMIQIDELSDNSDFNKFLPFIKIRHTKKPYEEYEIVENEGKELFIHPEFDAIIKTIEKDEHDRIIVPFDRILDSMLFTINIENNELTKPLKELDKLLNAKYFNDIHITADKMEQKFIELMIESNINVSSIHAAVILRSLVRKTDDFLARPDFSKLFVDYVVLGYHQSLFENPAITTSLAYDHLRKQLTTYSTYKKHSKSPLDLLFSRTITGK